MAVSRGLLPTPCLPSLPFHTFLFRSPFRFALFCLFLFCALRSARVLPALVPLRIMGPFLTCASKITPFFFCDHVCKLSFPVCCLRLQGSKQLRCSSFSLSFLWRVLSAQPIQAFSLPPAPSSSINQSPPPSAHLFYLLTSSLSLRACLCVDLFPTLLSARPPLPHQASPISFLFLCGRQCGGDDPSLFLVCLSRLFSSPLPHLSLSVSDPQVCQFSFPFVESVFLRVSRPSPSPPSFCCLFLPHSPCSVLRRLWKYVSASPSLPLFPPAHACLGVSLSSSPGGSCWP